MLGFLDNGFFIFLIIALLSAVSEWLAKRRAAKGEDDTVPAPPIRPVRPGDGSRDPVRQGEAVGKPKPGSLFEQLEKELRRLTEDGPLVEVLEDEPVRKSTRQQRESAQAAPAIETGVPQISDPVQAQRRKLAELEQQKKEAAQKLREARRKAESVRRHPKVVEEPTHFVDFGTNARQIRQWVRDRKRLRSAIVLNTILETPKGLQPGNGES